MTCLALLLSGLILSALAAAESAPAPNQLGGLRRAASLGVALDASSGRLAIGAVGPGSAAEKIGLQPGDVIVSLDRQPVADAGTFVAAVGRKRAGDRIAVAVERGGQALSLEGALGAVPLERQPDYEIEYGHVTVDGTRRRTLVTRPRSGGKHPAVLLIGGIGCYSLDGLLRPTPVREPYAKLLDQLTRAGYVTMRVEKSGMGDSEGVPCADPRADFETEVRAFAAGLRQLETLKGVDKRNVFVFAHSIGPLIAARIAAERPVRGLVLAETIGTSWLEYELTNVRRQLLLQGVAHDDVDRRMRQHERCAHRFYVEKQSPEQIVAAEPNCAGALQAPAPYTYMQQVAAVDLAPLWKKIDAPVLIFYGTADFVTDAYQHEYLQDMINAFHPGRATYVVVDGMDHGLTLAGSQKAAFGGASEAPFAQRVADETLRFLEGARAK